MATLTLRIPKGSPLTNLEVDNNFVELDNNKIQLGGDLGGTTSSPVVISLRGRSVSTAAPTTGQTLVWTGTSWTPQTVYINNGTSNIVSSTVVSLPAFSAYASNTELQTITYGSQQKVKFQLEEFDTASCYDTSNSRFTPNRAGYYQINAEIRFDGNIGSSNEQMIALWKNGAEYKRGWNTAGGNGSSSWFAMTVNSLVYFNGTTDYVEVYAQHGNSSNSLTITGVNQTGITWFNGIMVPNQILTSVTAITGAGNPVVVLNDISNFFNRVRKVFTLKSGSTAITEGVNYRDNRDFTVIIGGRNYYAQVPQVSTLGPWIVDYVAGRTYEFKVTGSKLIFYREIFDRQGAEIRINNVSASRQKRNRYPFSANSIVLGE